MLEINSFGIGPAQGAIGKLPSDLQFPSRQKCLEMMFEGVIPFKLIASNGDGPAAVTVGMVKAALVELFANVSMGFGKKVFEPVDTALSFKRWRDLFCALTGRDFQVADQTDSDDWKSLIDLNDNAVVTAPIAKGSTVNVRVQVGRAFTFERISDDLYIGCPGETQMREVKFETKRGSGFTASSPLWTGDSIAPKWAQDGVATFTYYVDTADAKDDRWARVPRLFIQDERGRISHGPEGGGMLYMLWEETHPGYDTELGLVSVERDGQEPIHSLVQADKLVAVGRYKSPGGLIDMNKSVTLLVQSPERARLEELPTATGFRVTLPTDPTNPLSTVWLYLPTNKASDVPTAAANIAATAGGEVKLVSGATKDDPGVPAHVASISPMVIVRADEPDFHVFPGVLANLKNSTLTTKEDVPASIAHAAHAQVASASSGEAKGAAAQRVALNIAKYLPGGLLPTKGAANLAHPGANIITKTLSLKTAAAK